ncbi:Hypothetical protein ETEE_0507 [Edwardsiella anguillarum ET080813]|uniref:Uncharacterized protein n=1 Tax=Edwardsiella anguillarum ET080813 TaxID=667120 RepID=A0A076LMQ3_9GAMM|nr:Hypothetical protein ETEE_0507 [Edwardsiella anguillarum ET080813]
MIMSLRHLLAQAWKLYAQRTNSLSGGIYMEVKSTTKSL